MMRATSIFCKMQGMTQCDLYTISPKNICDFGISKQKKRTKNIKEIGIFEGVKKKKYYENFTNR